ncbi:hypothetical protein CAFE_23530 [Caprobacter fermentans]|uniref:Uncharacterized protein n=1 Tax=Caproicibacter fermentans TaxID=2576756 RepID=A0A6N8I0H6_9FIRM|nr:hypothetical protein [Caproicibacter fermentans]MVB11631.1 hypothetical protein [Caproicibacter fermentans]
MKTQFWNDEEQQIMDDLDGLTESEKIKTLEDSLAGEPEETGRRILRGLISKLRGGLS